MEPGRRRTLRWALVVVLILASGAAAAADQAGISLIVLVLAGVAVVTVPMVLDRLDRDQAASESKRRSEEAAATRDAEANRMRRCAIDGLLVRWPLTLEEADPYDDLRVSRSMIAASHAADGERAPYVGRAVDPELVAALERNAFVLLVGPSKAGKSRTAFEAARRVFRSDPLIVPRRPSDEPGALGRLFGELDILADLSGRRVVVWLDDVDEYIAAGDVDVSTLRSWSKRTPPVVVVATIREGPLQLLREGGSIMASPASGASGREASDILDRAVHVRVEARLTQAEALSAAALYPGENFEVGIGAQLVDAPRLVEKLDTGRSICPEGVAVMRAAVDWKRTGALRRAGRAELARLARVPDYRADLPPATPLTDERFEAGLEWCLKRLDSGVALLYVAGDTGDVFEPFDYLVAHADGEVGGGVGRRSVPDVAWQEILELVHPNEVLPFTAKAFVNRKWEVARAALRKGEEEPTVAPWALMYGGMMESEYGRLEEARTTLERAVALAADMGEEHAWLQATSLTSLGATILRIGDPDAATGPIEAGLALAERLSPARDATVATALIALAELRLWAGRTASAAELLGRAVELDMKSDPTGAAAVGARMALGKALRTKGDLDEAERAYRRAMEDAERAHGPGFVRVALCLSELGQIAYLRGDYAAAETTLERAVTAFEGEERGHELPPSLTHRFALCLNWLGNARRELGKAASARETLDRSLAIEESLPRPDWVSAAQTLLGIGRLDYAEGEHAAAAEQLDRAAALFDRQRSLPAWGDRELSIVLSWLGAARRATGEHERARDALVRSLSIAMAMEDPDPQLIAASMQALAEVRAELGEGSSAG